MATRPNNPTVKNGSWVTQWRGDEGRVRNKSPGPVKKYSKDVAYQRFVKWLSDEFYEYDFVRNPPSLMAVHDLCREYLVYAANYYRDANGQTTTEVRNIHYALNAYNDLFGEESITSLGPVQFRQFQNELIKQDKARTLINKLCGNVRRRGDDKESRTAKGYGEKYHPFYTTPSYRTAIRRACVKAKIDIWSPDQLRHYAKDILEKEYGVEVAAAVMGHNDVTTTKLYGERQLQRAPEAAMNRA